MRGREPHNLVVSIGSHQFAVVPPGLNQSVIEEAVSPAAAGRAAVEMFALSIVLLRLGAVSATGDGPSTSQALDVPRHNGQIFIQLMAAGRLPHRCAG